MIEIKKKKSKEVVNVHKILCILLFINGITQNNPKLFANRDWLQSDRSVLRKTVLE